jgi:hypothetical protein
MNKLKICVCEFLTDMESPDVLRLLSGLGGLRFPTNQEDKRTQNQPTEAHLAFIPDNLSDNVITLNAATLNRENMKTVFIGILTTSYTQTMWEIDRKKWIDHFQLLNQQCIDVKMLELRDLPGKVDSARAIVEINAALVILSNVVCGQSIRIIFLGPGMSQLTLDAFTHLVREWKTPDNQDRRSEDKLLQVVTHGDNKVFNLFKLCERLCLSGLCQSIEFYDTMKYYPFGRYRKSYFFKD